MNENYLKKLNQAKAMIQQQSGIVPKTNTNTDENIRTGNIILPEPELPVSKPRINYDNLPIENNTGLPDKIYEAMRTKGVLPDTDPINIDKLTEVFSKGVQEKTKTDIINNDDIKSILKEALKETLSELTEEVIRKTIKVIIKEKK